MFRRFAGAVALFAFASPASADDELMACIPLARVAWEATVEVYDDQLSGKPLYDAAKADPSEQILQLAKGMAGDDSSDCALALGLFGPDGMKAMMLDENRKDREAGRRPRAFD